MKLRYEYEYRFGSLIRGVRVGVENIMCNDEHWNGVWAERRYCYCDRNDVIPYIYE